MRVFVLVWTVDAPRWAPSPQSRTRGMRAIPGPANAFTPHLARASVTESPSTVVDAARARSTPAEARIEGAFSNAQRQLCDELDESLFLSAPWRRALDALDVDRFDPSVAECRHNVGWVRRGGWRSGRLPRASGVFRELGATSNGDGAGIMCDPTGEIRVIVHRELMESERALVAGCAVVIRDAPVLSAHGVAHAVVVTSESLVAVFEPDVDVDAVNLARRTKMERNALRERLRESAVLEAMEGVEFEDFEEDAGDGGGEERARESHGAREDEKDARTTETATPIVSNDRTTSDDAPAAEGPSDFALQLAALYAGEE